ncbi:MAG: tyrosine-type recombinase/integrase, partial [Deltaproteobacteria bacterium]|nr:tyrosine-type recombinase/integrase [Deltaproteobacteria bacterium]
MFIEFANRVRPGGKHARIFPELKRANNRYGHGLSKWFTKFKKGAGVIASPRKKTFHRFRHTFINHHKQRGTDLNHLKEVVGHSDGASGDITF